MDDRFSAEFEGLFGVAYRAAYGILGDRSEAEDSAQEALAKALVRWRRIEGYATPWVARVAANHALDKVRRRHRRRDASYDELVIEPTSASSTGSDGLVDRRRDLVAALNTLPKRQRDIVVLRHLADLSEADVAALMNCSVGTVKSSLSRGVARLRDELGQAWAWET